MEPDRALVPPLERAVYDRNGAVAVKGYLVHEKPLLAPVGWGRELPLVRRRWYQNRHTVPPPHKQHAPSPRTKAGR